MTEKKDFYWANGSTKKQSEFFSTREIWEQVFGKDGRGGVIKELDKKIDSQFHELEYKVCTEFKNLSKKLDEYNGLKEAVYEVKDDVQDVNGDLSEVDQKIEAQKEVCKRQLDALNLEQVKQEASSNTFKEGKEEAYREIKQFLKLLMAAFAVLGGVITLLSVFVF